MPARSTSASRRDPSAEPAQEAGPWDVVVVGAGAAGCMAAKELCEGGLRTLVLEAGFAPDPARDFRPGRSHGDGPLARLWCALRGQPLQARGVLFRAPLARFYVDDRRHPYASEPGRPFHWFRGRQVGGRLHTWARVLLRMSEAELCAWPLGYAELAPWYERVERFLGVLGGGEGMASIPDPIASGPWPPTAQERAFRARLAERFPGQPAVDARVVPHDPARTPAALRAAAATGRLALRPHAIAERLLLEGGRSERRARALRVLDARSGERREVAARAFVLCAGTLETNRLLLRSAHPEPGALALEDASGTLGRFLMDHCMVVAGGPLTGPDARGIEPVEDPFDLGATNGFYLPHVEARDGRPRGFPGAFGVQGGIGRGRPAWALVAYGEVLPRAENRVTLDANRRDAHGLAVPRVALGYGSEELAMVADMRRALEELARAGGLARHRRGPLGWGPRLLRRLARPYLELACGAMVPGSSNHEVGGARMGSDPADSVLDPRSRLWSVPNVRVTDGAAFPSAGFQNVTATILALSARAGAGLARELREGAS